jgi:hypothetical protein
MLMMMIMMKFCWNKRAIVSYMSHETFLYRLTAETHPNGAHQLLWSHSWWSGRTKLRVVCPAKWISAWFGKTGDWRRILSRVTRPTVLLTNATPNLTSSLCDWKVALPIQPAHCNGRRIAKLLQLPIVSITVHIEPPLVASFVQPPTSCIVGVAQVRLQPGDLSIAIVARLSTTPSSPVTAQVQ